MRIKVKFNPTKHQKNTISAFIILCILLVAFIIFTAPTGERECLKPLFNNSTAQYFIEPRCLQKIVDSIVLIEQISYSIKVSLIAFVVFFSAILIINLRGWVHKP